jgi:hypothetical protein
MNRECGDCTLCCKLLPVNELDKPANTKCIHQRQFRGCLVYHTTKMPFSCSLWNCRWLVNDDTGNMARPDRAHYVIDILPDSIIAMDGDRIIHIPTVQIWVDPKFPDAHKDPRLRAYLLRRGEEGIVGQIRFNSYDAMILIPPNMNKEKIWVERSANMSQPEGGVERIANALVAQGKKVERW